MFAVAEKALRRWVRERLRRSPRPAGGTIFSFVVSGSTCNNMGLPIEALMTAEVDVRGKIVSASVQPLPGDVGWVAMCAAGTDPARFFSDATGCPEAIGLSLREAAFCDWNVEPSGCFCTAGNRLHKWRNTFQAIHYAETHPNPQS